MMIELCLAILILTITTTLCFLYYQISASYLKLQDSHQDQMAILQLRQTVSIAQDVEVIDGQLNYIFQNQDIEILFDKNRLVKKGGYEILMENIQDAKFYVKGIEIYLDWTKENKRYSAQIL